MLPEPRPGLDRTGPATLKFLVAGGFGVGKTTLVSALSEVPAMRTEAVLTTASEASDRLPQGSTKESTTVAMDFGRITLTDPRHMVLLLFGTPGQHRFWFTWDELSYGARGAVVLADTCQLEDCFAAIGFFEQRGLPFIVAVNEFEPPERRYPPDAVRDALDVPAHVPVVSCDARDRQSALSVLNELIKHAMSFHTAPMGVSP
ncbi:ATP/GTP-binding protein [Streptomyces sp. MZ04]|uniref:GTP-binding protein n=1 Tax=Streptomyces sp. MZ04 TaxID=2559236 RepID=UPI001FD85535|nr:ATP/GTP-binding protein [Streptomyces sp. MZ04]